MARYAVLKIMRHGMPEGDIDWDAPETFHFSSRSLTWKLVEPERWFSGIISESDYHLLIPDDYRRSVHLRPARELLRVLVTLMRFFLASVAFEEHDRRSLEGAITLCACAEQEGMPIALVLF
jgi:hypothetical protein